MDLNIIQESQQKSASLNTFDNIINTGDIIYWGLNIFVI